MSKCRKVSVMINGRSMMFQSLKEASVSLNITSSKICVSCKYGVKVKGHLFHYV